jgi:hypothetical protein
MEIWLKAVPKPIRRQKDWAHWGLAYTKNIIGKGWIIIKDFKRHRQTLMKGILSLVGAVVITTVALPSYRFAHRISVCGSFFRYRSNTRLH